MRYGLASVFAETAGIRLRRGRDAKSAGPCGPALFRIPADGYRNSRAGMCTTLPSRMTTNVPSSFFVSPVPGLPFLSGTGVVHALHLCGNFLFYRFQVPCRSSIFPSPVGFFGRKGWLPRRFRRFEVHFRENSSFQRKCNFPEKASERACLSAPRSAVKPERFRKGMPNRGKKKKRIT